MIEQAKLRCDAMGETSIVRMVGTEGMNQLSDWRVDVLSKDAEIDLAATIGEAATLAFADEDGGVRESALVVIKAAYEGESRDGHRYQLVLSERQAACTRRSGYRVFRDLTAPKIVEQVLETAGLGDELELRLGGKYQVRPYCVQYDEREWTFIERLLADEGINYWFDTLDGKPRMILADGPQAHDPVEGDGVMKFAGAGGMANSASTIFGMETTAEMVPTKVHVRDEDVRNPDVPMDGVAGDGALEHFEFPANVIDADGARARAALRLEQLRARQRSARIQTHASTLQPGRVVTVAGAADDCCNGHHLVIEVRHELRQASANDATARNMVSDAMLVPHDSERAYRPEPPQQQPRVGSVESAIVTGPSGEEVHVDDLARIKVRFPWDRGGVEDDNSSDWVRTAQWNMAGSMMLPRIGWEVPIAYRHGDPNQPRCLGRLYNGAQPLPYGQPGKQATSSMMSATSPADGSTNEICFADGAGGMNFVVHASGDQEVTVGADRVTNVGGDKLFSVKADRALQAASQTLSVGGGQTIAVDGPISNKVAGARVVTAGSESIGITKNRTVDAAGGYSESVGGTYFLRSNKSKVTVGAGGQLAVGGVFAVVGAAGVNESVLGARAEMVAGSRGIATGSYKDSTTGVKTITCGAASFLGAKVGVKAGAALNINAAACSLAGATTITFRGSAISITCASFTSSTGYAAAGVHTLSGKVVADAPVVTYSSTKAAT